MKEKVKHLDFYVRETLSNLGRWIYPKMEIEKDDKNLFLGSGNASSVAKIFTEKFNGVALDASNYKMFLKGSIKKDFASIYIINASGGKDGYNMAKYIGEMNLKPSLITCNKDAPAKKFVDKMFLIPALIEPPTYNVSTYSSMIYWLFRENVSEIKELIEKLEIPDLRKYKYIFFLAADKFQSIAEMTSEKTAETLEGIGSNSDGFTNAFHGILRQPNKDRLIFCLNQNYPLRDRENIYELNIDSYLGLLLSTYYIIGKNQTGRDTENLLKNYQETVKELNWKVKKIF
jgi:fructoselysine-6-P-deglycase FrlB-like protein